MGYWNGTLKYVEGANGVLQHLPIKNLISGKKTWLANKRRKVSIDITLNACEHMIIDLTELRICKLLSRRQIF